MNPACTWGVNRGLSPVLTDSEPMMSVPSEMDEGAPEVGELPSSSEEPILVPLPNTPDSLVPVYEVGMMHQSSGHCGVHPYCNTAVQPIP